MFDFQVQHYEQQARKKTSGRSSTMMERRPPPPAAYDRSMAAGPRLPAKRPYPESDMRRPYGERWGGRP